jgi:hypothetical protein
MYDKIKGRKELIIYESEGQRQQEMACYDVD